MSVQQKAGVVLPAACAVAASFDPALARSVGAAQGQTEVDPNIKRSPLCGPNFAMFSEDPHLTAALAAAVVGGAQNAEEKIRSAEFEGSQAGLDAAVAWLHECYKGDMPRWTNIPSILDCEPDR